MLKAYFCKYLKEIRGLKDSSAKHYLDALLYISRLLCARGLLTKDIYEVSDIATLEHLFNILQNDEEFIATNKRGNQMYSAGFKNYLLFARGSDFAHIARGGIALDIPIAAPAPHSVTQLVYPRSEIVRVQALELAGFKCELDSRHESFIEEATQRPYMEGHHAIALHLQAQFTYSLDVYANVLCLCPLCHRKLHYGRICERIPLLEHIYEERCERLARSGIELSKKEFVELGVRFSARVEGRGLRVEGCGDDEGKRGETRNKE